MPTPQNRIYRVCTQCGKSFATTEPRLESGRGKFCSKACGYANRRASVRRVCLQCSKDFDVVPSQVRYGGGLFCSNACSSAYRRARHKSKKVDCVCAYCAGVFSVYPGNARLGGGVFCRKECCLKSQKESALPLEFRFWKYVNKTEGCWLWTGGKMSGYGTMKVSGKQRSAHRISWEIHNGAIPNGLWVLHKCDVHACVRPEHLFLGTPRDNSRDMAAKGRGVGQPVQAFGEVKPICEWLEDPRCRVKGGVLADRIRKGLSAEYAVSTPPIPAWKSGAHSAISRGCKLSPSTISKIREQSS